LINIGADASFIVDTVCYIIGIRKDIRAKINKHSGDVVRVTIKESK